ncbi:MAG: UDP-glucose 4-epimerase GalE [Hyphomicrobiales bacterium]|nr:MAG: UDP-glucose 4-epimerase GalE [Hyphomicrobiales bacterium]
MTLNCLVTGGAGFIGSHVCKELSRNGFIPVTLDNLATGHRDAVKWGPLIEGDILDTATLVQALRTHGPAAVLHFAASAYVGESVDKPADYYRNNVLGLHSLLEACREAGVGTLIFSSSCATYGNHCEPISETSVQQPINPYGRTKLIGEQMIADYATAYGLRFAMLRYFNAAGADPERELSERHTPETHLLPRAILAALGAIPPLEVFGSDYPTPDGTCVRDYIHVSDLAKAHVLAAKHLINGGSNLRLNLGAGVGSSVRRVIDTVADVTGLRVPYVLRDRRAGDPPSLLADISLARSTLGFEPQLSTLRRIVSDAAAAFLEARPNVA